VETTLNYVSSSLLDGLKPGMSQVDKHGCTPLYSAAMAINPNPKVAGLLVGAVWKHAGEETLMNSQVYRSAMLF